MALVKAYNSTKSFTALVLNQFSNILLPISEVENYQVPLKFSTASRLYKRLSDKKDSYTYRTPIMSLEFNGSSIDKERKTNPRLKRKVLELDADNVVVTYNDIPTNYEFTLTIIGDSLTTLTTLTEFITSSFRNNAIYTEFLSPLGESIYVPIKLGDIETELDNNEDSFEDNRYLSASLTLTVEGVVHSQIDSNGKYIKEIDFLLYSQEKKSDTLIESFTIVP